MYCDNCGKEIKSLRYSHKLLDVCEECWRQMFWEDVLNDDNLIVINQEAYTMVKNPIDGGFGQKAFTITMSDGTIHKHVGLWRNGTIPSDQDVKDNCISIKEKR